ncbi:ammonium transporter [Dactylosporangium sp. NPDC051485]|uniref:ammonium transporter n=1 Tax=Dactylosporangium sp. NPDC051485 TaxID=3154846 RepID=UPI003420B37D
MPQGFSAGDTAWLLVSAALVLLMVPGLALFYGGMVRVKSALNMLMMSFACLAVVTVVWVVAGYSLAFGPDAGDGLIGDLRYLGLQGISGHDLTGSVPTAAFAAFQLMFAVITAALLSGAIADRAKFGAWIGFVAVWVLAVYAPIAHWVFGGGWIATHLHIFDLAGGTVVEINSGASGLALALVLGPRLGFRADPMRPHSLPLVVLGAGLLWFGWFGFNAGSALTAGGGAAMAFLNTQVAGAAAICGWLLVERFRDGHPTTLGAASGAVAGLVAITPSCGSVSPLGALAIGAIAGVACCYAVSLKYRLGYDDSLDVAGVHGVGGLLGTLLIGLLATSAVTGGDSGLLYGGGLGLLGRQALAVVVVAAYAFGVTWLLAKGVDRLVGFRVSEEHERTGLDLVVHAETAYELHATSSGARTVVPHHQAASPTPRPARLDANPVDGQ